VGYTHKMNLAYVLGGLGKPNIEEKVQTLEDNLCLINMKTKRKVDLFVYCYDGYDIQKNNDILQYVNLLYVHHRKGVLAENWVDSNFDLFLQKYDDILLILDDVRLSKDFDITRLQATRDKYGWDLVSPVVFNCWWSAHFLLNHNNRNKRGNTSVKATANNHIELFCYLFNKKGYSKYYSIMTKKNPYLWWVDFSLGYFNIPAGVDHSNTVQHLFNRALAMPRLGEDFLRKKYHDFEKKGRGAPSVTVRYYEIKGKSKCVYETVKGDISKEVTDLVWEHFKKEDKLIIPARVNFNDIFTDICSGVLKYVKIEGICITEYPDHDTILTIV